jgi:alpha-tubulin suppressor-like RCC1 family protein
LSLLNQHMATGPNALLYLGDGTSVNPRKDLSNTFIGFNNIVQLSIKNDFGAILLDNGKVYAFGSGTVSKQK